uniref:Ubiquitin conjugation factor E4 core domain-containing protein n=1 Tax=Romanomermis culicivorax TaxID=13658 RepID=A0A915L6N7_ROMCU
MEVSTGRLFLAHSVYSFRSAAWCAKNREKFAPMTEDGTYKIFTSRNRISSDRDATMQKIDDVSSVGALPDFKARKTSKNRQKTIKTLNKSNLKPPSTARRRSKRLNPDFEHEETENNEEEIEKQRKIAKNKDKNDKTINISFVRENLRANNKALAVALEHAKVEIKSLKNEKIQFQTTIQELQSQLARFQEDAKSFEARFEKALEECVSVRKFQSDDDFLSRLCRMFSPESYETQYFAVSE